MTGRPTPGSTQRIIIPVEFIRDMGQPPTAIAVAVAVERGTDAQFRMIEDLNAAEAGIAAEVEIAAEEVHLEVAIEDVMDIVTATVTENGTATVTVGGTEMIAGEVHLGMILAAPAHLVICGFDRVVQTSTAFIFSRVASLISAN